MDLRVMDNMTILHAFLNKAPWTILSYSTSFAFLAFLWDRAFGYTAKDSLQQQCFCETLLFVFLLLPLFAHCQET